MSALSRLTARQPAPEPVDVPSFLIPSPPRISLVGRVLVNETDIFIGDPSCAVPGAPDLDGDHPVPGVCEPLGPGRGLSVMASASGFSYAVFAVHVDGEMTELRIALTADGIPK